jgi:hypothetical protein
MQLINHRITLVRYQIQNQLRYLIGRNQLILIYVGPNPPRL